MVSTFLYRKQLGDEVKVSERKYNAILVDFSHISTRKPFLEFLGYHLLCCVDIIYLLHAPLKDLTCKA